MANRWKNVETVTDFIIVDFKIIAGGDFSHESKRHLLLGRKAMTNLESTDITLSTKVRLVKTMVLRCKSWIIKKAEHWRIDVFELWCWRRLLRVLWIARRSDQSILKEISPKYSRKDWCWSWNSNNLATWCEESWLIWKDPDAGKDWRWEKGMREDEMVGWHHWLYGYEFKQALSIGWWTGKPGVLQSMGPQRAGHDWWLNWTEESRTGMFSPPPHPKMVK